MDLIHPFSTALSNSASLLLHPTNSPIVIPFHSHCRHRMIHLLLQSPSLPLRPFHSPKITCSASLGGGSGRRRGTRRRRKIIGSAEIEALRRAFSFAASFRPPAEPLDILLLFQNGGTGGGGRRGFWSRGTGGGGGWPKRRMPWKEGGLVVLLLSLAVAASASALGSTGEKDFGMRLLVPALLGLKRSRAWRREVGVLLLGFAFLLLLLKTVGRRIKNGRRRIVWRF